MAFALTLFLQAATRRVAPAPRVDSLLDDSCALLYKTLCADIGSSPAAEEVQAVGEAQPAEQTSLYQAFHVLCSHYDGDPLQAAVCARVLALYFLMEHSAGAALAKWVQPLPETPQFVSLHPAVIEALGTVRLNGSVVLSQSAFPELVAGIAAGSEKA